jgi:hypothetical protein
MVWRSHRLSLCSLLESVELLEKSEFLRGKMRKLGGAVSQRHRAEGIRGRRFAASTNNIHARYLLAFKIWFLNERAAHTMDFLVRKHDGHQAVTYMSRGISDNSTLLPASESKVGLQYV